MFLSKFSTTHLTPVPQLTSIVFSGQGCELFSDTRKAFFDPWCTGVIMPTIEEIEGESIQAIREDLHKEVWSVG